VTGGGDLADAARFPLARLATAAPVLVTLTDRVRAALPRATPAPLMEQLGQVHVPLAAYLAERRAAVGRTIVVGLGGGQGAGKSTLAALLACVLEHGFGLRAACVSLDDFYLTRAEREALAVRVHPELCTRGPGTHDVGLALCTLLALRDAAPGDAVSVPRFDKAQDDRVSEAAGPSFVGPLDVVLIEGVLVGLGPEPEAALDHPINDFEREHDPDGTLRRHAQTQLEQMTASLDPLLDVLLFLAVPDLERVLAWRREQEDGLGVDAAGRSRGMDCAALSRFVARFERLTRHALATLPARADVTLELDAAHRVRAVRVNP
jgi:D-glycerate 3-kinase